VDVHRYNLIIVVEYERIAPHRNREGERAGTANVTHSEEQGRILNKKQIHHAAEDGEVTEINHEILIAPAPEVEIPGSQYKRDNTGVPVWEKVRSVE
jgi:hypothetical protein